MAYEVIKKYEGIKKKVYHYYLPEVSKENKELMENKKLIKILRNYFSHYYHKIDKIKEKQSEYNDLYVKVYKSMNRKLGKTAHREEFEGTLQSKVGELEKLTIINDNNDIDIKVVLLILSPFLTKSLMGVILGKTLNRDIYGNGDNKESELVKDINNIVFRSLSIRERNSEIYNYSKEAYALGLLNDLYQTDGKVKDADDEKQKFQIRKQRYKVSYQIKALVLYLRFKFANDKNASKFKFAYYDTIKANDLDKFSYHNLSNNEAIEYFALNEEIKDNYKLLIKHNNIYVEYNGNKEKWSLIYLQTIAVAYLTGKYSDLKGFLDKSNSLKGIEPIENTRGIDAKQYLENLKESYHKQHTVNKHKKATYCLRWFNRLQYLKKL